jgi:hypothetical protein
VKTIIIREQLHCNYRKALGHLGLGNKEKADYFFNEVQVLAIDPKHAGAVTHHRL